MRSEWPASLVGSGCSWGDVHIRPREYRIERRFGAIVSFNRAVAIRAQRLWRAQVFRITISGRELHRASGEDGVAPMSAWFPILAVLILVSLPFLPPLYRALWAPVGIDCDERVPTRRQANRGYVFVSLVLLMPVFLFWWVVLSRGV